MNIQYLSDLHLEYKDNIDGLIHINKKADVVIIAGDLNIGSKIFTTLIELAKKQIIIFVYGNHEFYSNIPIWKFKNKGKIVTKHNKNLHILDRNSVVIGNITFIGVTGWIDGSFKNINRQEFSNYNDFHCIKGFDISCKLWGQKDRIYLQKTIAESKTKNNIIITHFLPLISCISTRYLVDRYNPCFSNNWEWIFNYKNKINYWIHGHSHESLDINLNGINFCRNPFGYPKETTQFKPYKIIELN